jgi:hypothetical protein
MHFTVLVIGDDPVAQLQPFREGEKNPELLGDNIEYRLYYPDEDDDEEVDEDEYYNWSNRECFDTEGAALEYALNNGLSTHRIVYEPAQTIYDWYEIGGRWAGYYKLKKDYDPNSVMISETRDWSGQKWVAKTLDGRTDTALLSEIDLHGMLVQEAWIDRKAYRLGKKLFSLVHFDEGVAKAVEMCTKLGKIAWNENESMRTYLNEMDTTYLFKSNSEQEYIKSRSGNTLSPYGLLYEGEYYESEYWDEDDDLNEGVSWYNHIKNLLLSLPSDTRITLVDCHI